MVLELSAYDLIGTWQIQATPEPLYLVFAEDGRYNIQVDMADNICLDSGYYTLTGTTLTFCSDASTYYCPNKMGSYLVMLTTQDQLRFFPLSDTCEGRLCSLRTARFVPLRP